MEGEGNPKSLYLKELIEKRNEKNVSILDTFDIHDDALEISESDALTSEGTVDIHCPPEKCPTCKGKGQTKGLFSFFECIACHGTGYDMTNPLYVIRWQAQCLAWSKTRINQQQKRIKELVALPEEERQAIAREQFYKDARRID
jgi:RecJ-like exonuclease